MAYIITVSEIEEDLVSKTNKDQQSCVENLCCMSVAPEFQVADVQYTETSQGGTVPSHMPVHKDSLCI